MRLAIGDVYKVRGTFGTGDTRDYIFEICGEAFVGGRRFAIGVKQKMLPADDGVIVVFDERGVGETIGGDFRWIAWETSRAKPKYQRAR